MPKIDYAELRSQLRILDVLTQIGWQSTQGRGEQLRGPCPLCGGPEVAPSFSVNTRRNIYRCFRCGSQGNVIDFWKSYSKLPIHAAAQQLMARTSRRQESETSNHQSKPNEPHL